jgi:hypothetical protein
MPDHFLRMRHSRRAKPDEPVAVRSQIKIVDPAFAKAAADKGAGV